MYLSGTGAVQFDSTIATITDLLNPGQNLVGSTITASTYHLLILCISGTSQVTIIHKQRNDAYFVNSTDNIITDLSAEVSTIQNNIEYPISLFYTYVAPTADITIDWRDNVLPDDAQISYELKLEKKGITGMRFKLSIFSESSPEYNPYADPLSTIAVSVSNVWISYDTIIYSDPDINITGGGYTFRGGVVSTANIRFLIENAHINTANRWLVYSFTSNIVGHTADSDIYM